MPAYLLIWNPENWNWQDLAEESEKVTAGIDTPLRWSSGNRRNIPIGSRVYLMRLGQEPKGIIASGWTTSEVYPDEHWNPAKAAANEDAYYVEWYADVLLDPDKTPPLDVRHLPPGPASRVNWSPFASGTQIEDAAAEQFEAIWSEYTNSALVTRAAPDSEIGAVEGRVYVRLVKHRLRERSLRAAKLADAASSSRDGRIRCEVPGCEFDFEERYGELGRGFAQVHHLRPLAEAESPVRTRLEDLAVVCSNCHSMIHLGGECRNLQGLTRR